MRIITTLIHIIICFIAMPLGIIGGLLIGLYTITISISKEIAKKIDEYTYFQ